LVKIIYLDLVRCHLEQLCRERVISTVSFCFLNLGLCYNKNTCCFEFEFDVTLILCVLGIFI
jgi:tetrahydromethanopterin S-methyltransferase subunit E